MEEEKKKHREGKEYRDLVNRLSRIEGQVRVRRRRRTDRFYHPWHRGKYSFLCGEGYPGRECRMCRRTV